MPVTTDRRNVGIGIALAVAALLIAWLGYVKPNPFAHHTTIRAIVSDASSLGPVDAEVRMGGTPVGKVTASKRRGNDAVITLRLDRSAGTIHSDATVAIRPGLAFEGLAYVELDPGSPSAPRLDGPIPLSHTHRYVALDDVLRLATTPTRRAIQQTAAGLARGLSPTTALRRTIAVAPGLLADGAVAANAARGPRDRSLTRAIQGLATTSAAVAHHETDLAPLLRDTRATTDALRGPDLQATIQRLPATAAALRTGGASLTGVVDRLEPLARDLLPTARKLPGTLDAVRPVLRQATPVLRRAQPVVRDVRQALDAGARATPPTRQAIRALTPTLTTLDRSLIPALLKDTSLGIPAYRSFLSLFEGGGGASRVFQTDSKMGNGHFMRFGFRFLTGLGLPLPPCTLLSKVKPALATQFGAAGVCTP